MSQNRLLDLGFEQDISFVLSTIKEQTLRKVQKVLLSATLSKGESVFTCCQDPTIARH